MSNPYLWASPNILFEKPTTILEMKYLCLENSNINNNKNSNGNNNTGRSRPRLFHKTRVTQTPNLLQMLSLNEMHYLSSQQPQQSQQQQQQQQHWKK